MFKSFEEIQKFGKDQFDAANVSASSWTKGVQQMAAEASDFSKKSIEASSGFFERLMGAKSVEKVIEINSDYARSAYEGLVSQATKMGELYTNLAKDAFKPVEEAYSKVQTVAK